MQLTTQRAKPNKKQALFMVKELIKEQGLTYELECLYKYFLPALPTKPKTKEQWVQRVAAKNQKDIREYLHNCHVLDGSLYATDGHRMHWTYTSLDNGDYHHATLEPVTDVPGRYPDVKRVIPKHKKFDTVRPNEVETITINDLPRVVVHGITLDAQYFHEACAGFESVTMHYNTEHDSVLISHDFGYAVVMPVRNPK